jgi:branched-chain amino acid transport system ATP-binding protein
MSALLSVLGVTVRFGGVEAVKDVSFDVDRGELLGFIGPNGAGKTTLMRVITGLVEPATGAVVLQDRDLNGLAVHQRVRHGLGLAQQIVKPFNTFTVLDNVALAAGGAKTARPWRALFHYRRGSERERARGLLDLVGIGHVAEAHPPALPLGYRKRLELARALALEPRLLLLDEPLAGLNKTEAAAMADTIAELNGRGLGMILIEHNLGEVMRICPRLVVQDNGRKIGDGPTGIVMDDPHVRAAYLGGDGGA